MNLFNNLHRVCLKSNLDVFSILPVTFVFNCEDLNFFSEVDHFFRYFKALKVFNLLQQREDFELKESERRLGESTDKGRQGGPSEEAPEQNEGAERAEGPEEQPRTEHSPARDAECKPVKEEFALRPLIIRIVKEIKKIEAGSESKTKKKEDKKADLGEEYRMLKKLSQVMNFPGHVEDDRVEDALAPTGLDEPNAKPEKSEKPAQKLKAPDSKWHYITRFRRSLFNKKKKLVRVPEPRSTFGCYYYSQLRHSFNLGRNLWLLKVSQYNRGFGIELFRDLKQFTKHLCNFKMGYEEALVDSQPDETGQKAETGRSGSSRERNARNQEVEHDDPEQEVRHPEVHRAAVAGQQQEVRYPAVHPGGARRESLPLPRNVHPRVCLRLRFGQHAEIRASQQHRASEVLEQL